MTCSMLNWPDNGALECTREDYIYGTVCNTVCYPGYEIEQSEKSTKCGESGQWSKPATNCSRK